MWVQPRSRDVVAAPPLIEVNFDGLVGPTHSYAGLSYGNVASTGSAQAVSSPKQAALQGLAKMKALHDLGLVQGVLPPQERPDLNTLRAFGFSGSDEDVLRRAAQHPPLLALCCSASAMWTANAATVAPSVDTDDGRVHFTPANLVAKAHRAIEAEATRRALLTIFADKTHFTVHEPLPGGVCFGDEGAANHTRLFGSREGAHLFVYGRKALDSGGPAPVKFPARQTLEASQAVARLNRIDPIRAVFAQQHPATIDAGVFHNDVIAVGSDHVLFVHERAFLEQSNVLEALKRLVPELKVIEVFDAQVSVEDAVKSYLFNSQLVRIAGHEGLTLIAPVECEERDNVREYLGRIVAKGQPIEEMRTFDLRQSMRNGGGPACLRLRVPLTAEEIAAMNQACLLTEDRYLQLVHWVGKHYRDRLAPDDLADPRLLLESRYALDELTQILSLGSLYPFQRNGTS